MRRPTPAMIGRVLVGDVLPTLVAEVFLLAGSTGAAANDAQGTRTPLDALAYALLATAGAALLVRRHHVTAFFAVELAMAAAYLGLGYPYGPVLIAVAVATFSLAVRRPLPVVVPASAVGAVALAAADAVGSNQEAVVRALAAAAQSCWVLIPALVGQLARAARRARARADEETDRRLVEEERLRLAREVHDVVGHGLSVISLHAGVALHVLEQRPDQAQVALEAIRRASTEALDELRATLALTRGDGEQARRTPVSGLGRLAGLTAELRSCGLPVRVETTGPARPLPHEVELAAFRIVQEALTNVLRHAGAAQAWVSLDYAPDGLSVVVRDDGTSPPAAHGNAGFGHGLTGLRERAAELGGSVAAGPDPAGGWRVDAWLPS